MEHANGATRAWIAVASTKPSANDTQTPQRQRSEQAVRANAAMLRYAKGDDAAFRELYRLLAPRLQRLCRWLCANEADELFQEVFLKIHRSRAMFVDSGSVFAWAAAIARKTHVDRVRYRARRHESLVPSHQLEHRAQTGAVLPDARLVQRDLQREVEREVGLLSDNLRGAYDLVKIRGLTHAEASAELGAPIDAVKQRVHRASEEIRDSLTLYEQAG